MNRKKTKLKLLSKTTIIYLLFTFIAFSVSALYLIQTADKFISTEIERRFYYVERRITKRIKDNSELKRLYSGTSLERITKLPAKGTYPLYKDTSIVNAETGEVNYYRKKTTIIGTDTANYKLTILRSINDFYVLREDIFDALIPSFIILAIAIVIFNYLLSGFYFKPFNKILNHMKYYKAGNKIPEPINKISTMEFNRMQELFLRMVKRIDSDFRKQKEYTENMAHEIQTPLSIIRNKSESLLSDEKVMEQYQSEIKTIYDETNHLSKLGETLNLITKIENGEFRNEEEIFTKDIILNRIETVREAALLKNLKITHKLSDNHKLQINPFLFEIVLTNLVRNAIYNATDKGPIEIVTTDNSFTISNFGEIPDEPQKIFERFYSTNKSENSLGLGLALVHKICEVNNLLISYNFTDGQHNFVLN